MKTFILLAVVFIFVGCSVTASSPNPNNAAEPTGADCNTPNCRSLMAAACPAGSQGAVFIAEVPPPVSVDLGEAFTASVTVANCGPTDWNATAANAPTGYKLGFATPRDSAPLAPARIALPESVPVGSAVTVTISGRGPNQVGSFAWGWSIVHEGVEWLPAVSPAHTVLVRSPGSPSCGVLGTACCEGASCQNSTVCDGLACVNPVSAFQCSGQSQGVVFVSEVLPPAVVAPGAPIFASVTLANCGTATWDATAANAPTGYKLGFDSPRDSVAFGTNRIALPASTGVGQAVTIPIAARAPNELGNVTWAWSVLREGVAWLSGSSPVRTIEVRAAANVVTICAGVAADLNGTQSASAQLQQCVDATAVGGVLEIPAGIYRMTGELVLNRPMTIRTAGTASVEAGCLEAGGPACAILRADEALNVAGGFFKMGQTESVTVDHLVLDGNRERRLDSEAARICKTTSNANGFNAQSRCTNCSFLRSASIRALCGTGMEWFGAGATVTRSIFRDNGRHTDNAMWADGLTLLQSDGAKVTQNTFIDNSDIDFIFGGGTNAMIAGNTVIHQAQATFAGLMLDNFNNSTSGDFTNTVVRDNSINCGAQQCDFGIELGPHPWYLSRNLIGGTVSNNAIVGGKIQINCEGAGTAAQPMFVTGNQMGPSPERARFNCGTKRTTVFNISPDSFVNTGAGPAATGSFEFHICP